MIKVYVWRPDGNNVGHASMSVRQSYISWWPAEGLGKNNVKVIMHCDRGINHSFLRDVRDEGRHPTDWVIVRDLDENDVINWWVHFRVGGIYEPQWCTLTLNCSTIVAHALSAGGALQRLDLSKRIPYDRLMVWEPMDVLRFAREIAIRPQAPRPQFGWWMPGDLR